MLRIPLLVLMAIGSFGPGCSGRSSQGPAVRIGQALWQVELATTPEARTTGLAGRREVPAGAGMLFVFPQEKPREFHMLNCHVGLDIAFINAAGTVVETRTMPCEKEPADPQVRYPSRYPILYALEVGQGELAKAGVKVGDKVELLGAAKAAAKDAR
jgi:hypothetical protein